MSLKELYFNIIYLQTTLSAIVALACFYKFSWRQPYIKLIGLLFAYGVSNTVVSFFLPGKYLNIPGSLYDFVLFIAITQIYNLTTEKRYWKTYGVVAVLFVIGGIANLFFVQHSAIASNNKLFSSMIIICYSIFYFYRLIVEMPSAHVHRLPMFWFNSALLLYHSGTIFLFAFTSYLVNVMKDELWYYWIFHNVLCVIEYCIILIGIFYDIRQLPAARAVTRMKD